MLKGKNILIGVSFSKNPVLTGFFYPAKGKRNCYAVPGIRADIFLVSHAATKVTLVDCNNNIGKFELKT
jgi:hypothetical protein